MEKDRINGSPVNVAEIRKHYTITPRSIKQEMMSPQKPCPI